MLRMPGSSSTCKYCDLTYLCVSSIQKRNALPNLDRGTLRLVLYWVLSGNLLNLILHRSDKRYVIVRVLRVPYIQEDFG